MDNDITEAHMIDAADLAIVIEGFNKVSKAMHEALKKEEFEKFKEAFNRIGKAINSDDNLGD